jgi:hypothetical protein
MLASKSGADQAASARASVFAQQQQEQDALNAQQKQAIGGAINNFSPTNQTATQGAATAARQGTISAATTPMAGYSATDGMNPSAPRVVGQAARTAVGNASGLAAGEGNALARQGSFGDLMTGNNIALNRAGQNIGNLASFSQGDANLLPLQIQAANQQGQGLRGLGSLLTDAGAFAGVANAFGSIANDAGSVANVSADDPAFAGAAAGVAPTGSALNSVAALTPGAAWGNSFFPSKAWLNTRISPSW